MHFLFGIDESKSEDCAQSDQVLRKVGRDHRVVQKVEIHRYVKREFG